MLFFINKSYSIKAEWSMQIGNSIHDIIIELNLPDRKSLKCYLKCYHPCATCSAGSALYVLSVHVLSQHHLHVYNCQTTCSPLLFTTLEICHKLQLTILHVWLGDVFCNCIQMSLKCCPVVGATLDVFDTIVIEND